MEEREIHKRAHHNNVISLCPLSDNKLLSCGSSLVRSIKVWSLSDVDLTLIKEIEDHTFPVQKVIPLSKGRFASCCWDRTVKIWKDDNTYKCISTLEHGYFVDSIVQLIEKEVLISAYIKNEFFDCFGLSSPAGVSF